jgi:uncharacterized protein
MAGYTAAAAQALIDHGRSATMSDFNDNDLPTPSAASAEDAAPSPTPSSAPPAAAVTRRRFLATALVGAAGVGGYARWIEPRRLQITRHVLGPADSSAPPLRLVHLTDLHLRRIGAYEEGVAEAVHQLRPQLIAITGDSVDRANRGDVLESFLRLLPAGVPAFATLGNWEHWSGFETDRLRAIYGRRGVRLLVNESVDLRHGGRRLLITGMDDATGGRPDLGAALDSATPAANHVVLAHSPTYRDRLSRELSSTGHSPVCVLSGHTHGGQVALAGWAPLRPPGSGDYTAGWYRDREPHLYVSRGIGTSVLPVRLGSTPELARFDWHLRP